MNNGATSITINGPGTGLLTVNGGGDGEVFQIDAGATVTVEGLTITNASLGDNAAIDDLGSFTISKCISCRTIRSAVCMSRARGRPIFSDCSIDNDNSYSGAGIYVNRDTASITNCTLSGNTGGIRVAGGYVATRRAPVSPCRLHAQWRFHPGRSGASITRGR